MLIPPPATSAPATNVPTAANTVTPVSATVVQVSDMLQQVTRQIQLTGTVTEPPTASAIIINSALGEVTLNLSLLPAEEQQKILQQLMALFTSQKPLTLILQPSDTSQQAVLLLPQNSAAASSPPPLSVPTAAPQPLALPQVVGIPLTAIVLPSAQTNPPLAQAENALLPPPAQPPDLTATKQTPLPPALPQNPLPPVAAAQSQAANNILVPGQPITVRIEAAISPAAQNPTPPMTADQIIATVTGKGVNGELIVQSGSTNLFIRQAVDVPVGGNLVLTVSPAKADIPTLITPDRPNTFSSLEDIFAALQQSNPTLAQQITTAIAPQPNAQLGGTMLFFLNALQQGNLQGWLGANATETLKQLGKLTLFERLSQDIAQATPSARDASVGEWKSFVMPMLIGQNIETLNLYVHRDRQQTPQDSDRPTKASKIRFLIDVRMSVLGSLQIDGLLHPKKLDMIVRSERTLPSELVQELRTTYATTLDAMGYHGGLGFQTGRQNWIVMQNKPTSHEI